MNSKMRGKMRLRLMKSDEVDYAKRELTFNIMLTIGLITFIIMMLGIIMI